MINTTVGKDKKVYWFLFSYTGEGIAGAMSASIYTRFVTRANLRLIQEYLKKELGKEVIVTGFSYMGSALDTDNEVTGE